MSTEQPAITVEQLEQALRTLCHQYVNSLTTATIKWEQIRKVRLECSGDGVSVMYDKAAPEHMPTLVVSLTPKR